MSDQRLLIVFRVNIGEQITDTEWINGFVDDMANQNKLVFYFSFQIKLQVKTYFQEMSKWL